MNNNFNWQHIEFIDGSNPYVCKTKKEFNKIKKKYILKNIKENYWKAEYLIKYLVVCFPDKNKNATYSKLYSTKEGAMRFINKSLKENKYELLMLRKEEIYLKNSDSLEISASSVVGKFINE